MRGFRTAALVSSLAAAMALAWVWAAPLAAQAADWPQRPVRILVGTSPGAAPDILGRILAQRLTEQDGQPVLVENRPGAGGNLAGQQTAQARADGYTLWLITAGSATAPAVYASLGLDPRRDLVGISRVATVPFLLVANPSLAAASIGEFISKLKARSAANTPINYASAGTGSLHHLAGEQFKRATGVAATHVPYKGAAAEVVSIAAGETDYGFAGVPAALPLVRSGKLVALAVTTAARYPGAPNVATMKEAGLDGFVFDNWHGLMAPARTPAATVEAINASVSKALTDARVVKSFFDAGAAATHSSAEEFQALVASETERWSIIARALDIKPE